MANATLDRDRVVALFDACWVPKANNPAKILQLRLKRCSDRENPAPAKPEHPKEARIVELAAHGDFEAVIGEPPFEGPTEW